MIRFYLDENLSPQIAAIAPGFDIDATSSHEVGLNGKTDEEQLSYATSVGRCILTNDLEDFLDLAERYAREDRLHAGILLLAPSLPPDAFLAVAQALQFYGAQYNTEVIHHTDWLHPAPRE